MIKKLLFIASVPFLGITMVSAQCTPNYTGTVAGLDPDSLPHATVNVAYSQVIQMLVPSDTAITEFNGQQLSTPVNATVNYVDLINLDLGSLTTYSFSYATVSQDPNGDNTHFPGGSEGCVFFNAPASNGAPVGNYPVAIYVKYNADIPDFGIKGYDTYDTITSYSLIVDKAAGISVVSSNSFQLLQNSPNPFNGTSKVDFISPKSDTYTFTVYNMVGEVVYSQKTDAKRGLNSIVFDGSILKSGMYTYSIGNADVKTTKIMTVSK